MDIHLDAYQPSISHNGRLEETYIQYRLTKPSLLSKDFVGLCIELCPLNFKDSLSAFNILMIYGLAAVAFFSLTRTCVGRHTFLPRNSHQNTLNHTSTFSFELNLVIQWFFTAKGKIVLLQAPRIFVIFPSSASILLILNGLSHPNSCPNHCQHCKAIPEY